MIDFIVFVSQLISPIGICLRSLFPSWDVRLHRHFAPCTKVDFSLELTVYLYFESCGMSPESKCIAVEFHSECDFKCTY